METIMGCSLLRVQLLCIKSFDMVKQIHKICNLKSMLLMLVVGLLYFISLEKKTKQQTLPNVLRIPVKTVNQENFDVSKY